MTHSVPLASSSSSRSRGSFPSALRGSASHDAQRPRHEHRVDQRAEFATQIFRAATRRDDQRGRARGLAFRRHEHRPGRSRRAGSRSCAAMSESEPRRPPILIMSASRPNNRTRPSGFELDAVAHRDAPGEMPARTEVAPSVTPNTRSGYGVQSHFVRRAARRHAARLRATVDLVHLGAETRFRLLREFRADSGAVADNTRSTRGRFVVARQQVAQMVGRRDQQSRRGQGGAAPRRSRPDRTRCRRAAPSRRRAA